MLDTLLTRKYTSYLRQADIEVNGSRPWDMQVHNQNLYRRLFLKESLALGESYMDGWWDCQALDQFFTRLIAHYDRSPPRKYGYLWLYRLPYVLRNFQNILGARKVGEVHYDTGNELFHAMLDRNMMYSCAYWKDASTLDLAQEAKMRLIGEKLKLESGMRVLDIGCGWGGMAHYLAEQYGVSVVGITISKEQLHYAREHNSHASLEFRLQDYRTVTEQFDRVYSIGMFEHVGPKNYLTYMRKTRALLKEDGLALLHTIGTQNPSSRSDPWVGKYIFPYGVIPGSSQLTHAFERLFVLEDWQNFGYDYSRTLMAWMENFKNAWPLLRQRYDERFYRMWSYYLLCCAGSFRARINQLWQLVLSPRGVNGTYHAPR